MTDKEIQASDEEMERFNISQDEKCVSAEEVKMIKAELNRLAEKDKYSNIYECTLRVINLYEEIILGNQIEILELEKENDCYKVLESHYEEIEEDAKVIAKENEELKKNALVWHKVTCFDKPDENGCITNDNPSDLGMDYLIRLKSGDFVVQSLSDSCDYGVVLDDYEWEDVDAWAELPRF